MREEVGKGGEDARYGVRLETCNWERGLVVLLPLVVKVNYHRWNFNRVSNWIRLRVRIIIGGLFKTSM